MSREGSIYKRGLSPVMAYLSLKREGKKVPLSWLKRQEKFRQKLNDEVAHVLQNVEGPDITVLSKWELIYEKECFFNGIRYLFELDHQSLKSYQPESKPEQLSEGNFIGHAMAAIKKILEKRDLTLRDAETIAINHTIDLPLILPEIARSYKVDFAKGIIYAAEISKM